VTHIYSSKEIKLGQVNTPQKKNGIEVLIEAFMERVEKPPSLFDLFGGNVVEAVQTPLPDSWHSLSLNEKFLVQLIATQRKRDYSPYWVVNELIEGLRDEITPEILELAGKHLGYKRGWAQHEWARIEKEDPYLVQDYLLEKYGYF
jgi:hypothetical protein